MNASWTQNTYFHHSHTGLYLTILKTCEFFWGTLCSSSNGGRHVKKHCWKTTTSDASACTPCGDSLILLENRLEESQCLVQLGVVIPEELRREPNAAPSHPPRPSEAR